MAIVLQKDVRMKPREEVLSNALFLTDPAAKVEVIQKKNEGVKSRCWMPLFFTDPAANVNTVAGAEQLIELEQDAWEIVDIFYV
jgi:hypothetical protein